MFQNQSPSGRKRWFMHDGPQSSLRRLRSQLAEDGCPESQVVLAMQLLEEKCELEADKISNFKQALEWLICATEQGHIEARHHLKRCVRSGVLDERSAAIVRAKSCLKASRQETVARKAARDLFASLSNGKEHITTAQLEKRIREICSVTLRGETSDSDDANDDNGLEGEFCDSRDDTALEPSQVTAPRHADVNGTNDTQHVDKDYEETLNEVRNLTVDNLVSAAIDYCQGELPLVSYDLTLTDPRINSLDHIPLLHRAFLHPIVFIQVLYLKLLYYIGSCNFRLTNIELSLLLLLYLSFSSDNLTHFVPLFLYYMSFVAMVVCTFKMLHAKRQFTDFRKWSGLFLRYSDGNLQPDESENLFVKNNLGPFLHFFIALLVNLFIFPFISTQWVPFSEFCVLSFVLMFLSLFSFASNGRPYPDFLALISFGISVLAKYPYEKDTVVHQGWRFLDLHIQNYPSYILGNSIEFCLNARLFFSLLSPLIIFVMAKRSNWQGFFKHALPHCVTLSWLQMFVVCSQGCTTYGLIRGTLALVCSFLFLPLVGVVTLVLPLFAVLQYVALSKMIYLVTVVIGFGLGLAMTCVMAKLEPTRKFVTPIQLTVALITLLAFGNQFATDIQDNIPSDLIDLGDDKSTLKNIFKTEFVENTYYINWVDYYINCHAPSWIENNMADTQIKCAVLHGANVNWEGYIKEVRIKNVMNRFESIVLWMPELLQEYLRCYYGEKYTSVCSNEDFEGCDFVMSVASQSGKGCHLNNLNEYTYELIINMEASGGLLKRHADIKVQFEHSFTNFTRLLKADDKISFKGTLQNPIEKYELGTRDFTINGYEMNCIQCARATGSISTQTPSRSKFGELFSNLVSDVVVSSKNILNFILNPIVTFK